MYALGGMASDTTPQALVRVYQAEKDQWQPLTSMPTPRYGATAFLIGNKIYILGETLYWFYGLMIDSLWESGGVFVSSEGSDSVLVIVVLTRPLSVRVMGSRALLAVHVVSL